MLRNRNGDMKNLRQQNETSAHVRAVFDDTAVGAQGVRIGCVLP